jgi:hypothetical protein
MILDACRNAPEGRAHADNPLTPAYPRGFHSDVRTRAVTAFATLYATAVGARAYEYKERKQGYFTWELVEALKGKAANERGEVTLAGLVKYLQDNVPKRVLLDLGAGKDQRPFAIVEGYKADELVLAVANPNAARAANNSAQPEPISIQPEPSRNEPSAEAGNSLEGTTWTGSNPTSGEYTLEFLKGGQLNYVIKVLQNGVTSPRTVKGTWKQSGTSVQIVIGNSYSVLQGTIDGSVMKGQGTNQEGTEWKWTLFKKQ